VRDKGFSNHLLEDRETDKQIFTSSSGGEQNPKEQDEVDNWLSTSQRAKAKAEVENQ
jgi:hypothetical protein